MKPCSVPECRVEATRRGMCNNHYRAFMRNGDPLIRKTRIAGTGSIRTDGYIMHESGGRAVLNHVLIAERAIGKKLPKGAEVHHVDENRGNDSNSNLVICPSRAYHALLHSRARAFDASGRADWRKCQVCQKYDDPKLLKIYSNGVVWHKECNDKRTAERKAL